MESTEKTNRQFRFWVTSIYAVIWLSTAISPHHRADWALENVLVLLLVSTFILSWNKFCLTRTSTLSLALFMVLHAVGSHYTYSLVPYDSFFRDVFGFSLNSIMGWERNNFDRLVHFSYGLLLAYPLRELLIRGAHLTGFWRYFLPLDVTMSTSMIYELIEWGAAVSIGGELGAAYLGTQGDAWDAHKDMLLASTGALIAMTLTFAVVVLTSKEPRTTARREMQIRFSPLESKKLG